MLEDIAAGTSAFADVIALRIRQQPHRFTGCRAHTLEEYVRCMAMCIIRVMAGEGHEELYDCKNMP